MSGKLKFYKEKLDGYRKFYQIVDTIKKIALSKYQLGVGRVKTRDYTLRYSKKAFDSAFAAADEETLVKNFKSLYLSVGTNRGNCGPLNSANYRYLQAAFAGDVKGAEVTVIGKKPHDAVPRLFPDEYKLTFINDDKYSKSLVWANFLGEHLDAFEHERFQIIFNRYVSAASQTHCVYNIPAWDKFVETLGETAQNEPAENSNYRFANAILDMDEEDVKDFYNFHRNMVILNAVSENELSEHAARIIAVEGQLTNIAELRDAMQMLFNKTRQGAITSALIEILSAMTAMADSQKGSGIVKNDFWAASA